jgi:hypothetical protein
MWDWLKSNEAAYVFMAVACLFVYLTTIKLWRTIDRVETMLSKMIGERRLDSMNGNEPSEPPKTLKSASIDGR